MKKEMIGFKFIIFVIGIFLTIIAFLVVFTENEIEANTMDKHWKFDNGITTEVSEEAESRFLRDKCLILSPFLSSEKDLRFSEQAGHYLFDYWGSEWYNGKNSDDHLSDTFLVCDEEKEFFSMGVQLDTHGNNRYFTLPNNLSSYNNLVDNNEWDVLNPMSENYWNIKEFLLAQDDNERDFTAEEDESFNDIMDLIFDENEALSFWNNFVVYNFNEIFDDMVADKDISWDSTIFGFWSEDLKITNYLGYVRYSTSSVDAFMLDDFRQWNGETSEVNHFGHRRMDRNIFSLGHFLNEYGHYINDFYKTLQYTDSSAVYDEGFDAGYSEGYVVGWEYGIDSGYQDGYNTATYENSNIFDFIGTFFGGLALLTATILQVSIFGISIWEVVFYFSIISLLFLFIRVFRGN